MAKTQRFLFETEMPETRESGLILTPRAHRPLTKTQRAFNRLVAKVDELRSRIAAETKLLDEALVYYGTHLHPRLQRQNVQITYQTTGYGYGGQPGGLPMTVTVSLKCMTHPFYFLGALMHWVFTPPAGCTGTPLGPPMPTFATSLTSEDMQTN